MPMYSFHCDSCNTDNRRLLEPEDAGKEQRCRQCGGKMVRVVKPPSHKVVESLDNGLMAKRLERLADAERIYDEHRKSRDR